MHLCLTSRQSSCSGGFSTSLAMLRGLTAKRTLTTSLCMPAPLPQPPSLCPPPLSFSLSVCLSLSPSLSLSVSLSLPLLFPAFRLPTFTECGLCASLYVGSRVCVCVCVCVCWGGGATACSVKRPADTMTPATLYCLPSTRGFKTCFCWKPCRHLVNRHASKHFAAWKG
jgi:hypothetical protein